MWDFHSPTSRGIRDYLNKSNSPGGGRGGHSVYFPPHPLSEPPHVVRRHGVASVHGRELISPALRFTSGSLTKYVVSHENVPEILGKTGI